MGKELIVREGKGSRLTPFGENLMKQYRRMQSVVKTETNEVYKRLIDDDLNAPDPSEKAASSPLPK